MRYARRRCGRLRSHCLPLTLLAFVAAGCRGDSAQRRPSPRARRDWSRCNVPEGARCRSSNEGKLTIGTDNPAYPPWFGGGEVKGSKWQINDPSTGKGFESAVAYAVAKQLGFPKRRSSGCTCRSTARTRRARSRSTSTSTRSRSRRRARRSSTSASPYYDAEPGDRRAQGQADREGEDGRRPAEATSSARSSARRATTTSRTRSSRRARRPSSRRTPARSRR